MIFQLPINLEIENRNAQVIIDLETGFIGFTELIKNETVEYYYRESPIEFRKALHEKLELFIAKKSLVNWKICRKNEKMKEIDELLFKK